MTEGENLGDSFPTCLISTFIHKCYSLCKKTWCSIARPAVYAGYLTFNVSSISAQRPSSTKYSTQSAMATSL